MCVEPGDPTPGFVDVADDCGPLDPLRYPDAPEVCGDWLDDDCDGDDASCPATQPGIATPAWDCVGDTPPHQRLRLRAV